MRNIDKVLKYIKDSEAYLNTQYQIFDIYNGGITEHLIERLRKDMPSTSSVDNVISRLSPVNLLPKMVKKLSQVYSQSTVNLSNNNNMEQVEAIAWETKLGSVRVLANQMLNLFGCCAYEVVVKNNGQTLIRVLGAHEFVVYSDDEIDPTTPTHFIKVLERNSDKERYAIFTAEDYVEVTGGKVTLETANPYGTIPFVYMKRDAITLMPKPRTDDIEFSILLPIMLSDINFALKYQAFSIIYTMNLDVEGLTMSPNSVWQLKSNGQEGDKPEIGTIKPNLSVDDALKNVTYQFSLYLDTKNIKSSFFTSQGQNAAGLSGIAKIIDNSDVSDDIEYQRTILTQAEEELWSILAIKTGLDSIANTSVQIVPVTIIPELQSEKEERLYKRYERGLITRIDLIKEMYGFSEDSEAQEYIDLIEVTNVSRENEV